MEGTKDPAANVNSAALKIHATRRSSGMQPGSLASLATDYLRAQRNCLSVATIAARRRELSAFVDWVGGESCLHDVTRETASDYIALVLCSNGNTRKTNEDKIGHLNAFWAYAIRCGAYVWSNPWMRQAAAVPGMPDGAQETAVRRPWTAGELREVFSKKSARRNVWVAGVIGLYTGARLGELCGVRLWQVDLRSRTIYFYDARTQLPVRRVPIHPAVYPVIRRQCENSPDEYLVHGEPVAGSDHSRARYLSKRFTNWLRNDHGILDKGVVFQSLRNTFVEAAERAGVPESLVISLATQRRGFPALRAFGSAGTQDVLSDAVAGITFGELDDVVAALA